MSATSPKDVGGVGVDRVLVSQATREMASGVRTRDESAGQIQAQENLVIQLTDKKRQVDAALSALKGRVKGRTLTSSAYRELCSDQAKLKERRASIETELATAKQSLYRLKDEQREHRLPGDGGLKQVIVSLRTEMREMKLLLNQILDKVK